MKKKITGFVILLLVFVLGLSTNCFASFDISTLENELNVLKSKGLITETPKNAHASNWDSITYYSTYYDNSGHWGFNSYSIIITNSSSSQLPNRLIISLYRDTWGDVINNGDQWKCLKISDGSSEYIRRAYSFNLNGTNSSEGYFQYNLMSIKYAYTTKRINTSVLNLLPYQEYGGNYLTSSFDFNLASNLNINVVFNGTSETFNKFSYSRSVTSWLLGDFEIDDEDLVKFTLSRFLNDEYSVAIGGAEKKGDYINNYGLGISSDNRLYVNNVNVYYNQGYLLSIDLNGEFVEDFLIYFVPYGSFSTSGELISPDIDTNKDLELIKTLEDLVQEPNIDAILANNIPSGDYILSGDFLTSLGIDESGDIALLLKKAGYNFDYNPIMPWTYQMTYGLVNAVAGSGDEVLSFTLKGVTYNIHSNDFYVPSSPLKTLISIFVNGLIVIVINLNLFAIVRDLLSLDIGGSIEKTQVDPSFFM